jgi:hypothetical protein
VPRAGTSLAAAAAAVAAACGGAGCGKKQRQTRTTDAAPVELVSVAALNDGGVARPGETEEREPNDGADVATALAPGSAVRARIEPDADLDYYRIDVAQAGGLSVQVGAAPGTDLLLEIEDAAGATLAKSDRGGANVAEGVPNLGVTPGRYIAIVRKKPAPVKKPGRGRRGAPPPAEPAPGSGPAYEVTAQVAPFARNAEHEPDDDRGTANDLIIGDTVTGYIGWTGDADVWKLSTEALTARNVLDLELGPVEGLALSVEITDGIGQTLVSRKAPRGAALIVRGLAPVVAQGAPPFHYVTVRADRSNPEVAYQLKVTGQPIGTDPELEPNDTLERAMPIPADRTVINDASWTPGDVDCYAVPPDPAARTLDVSIDTPAESDLRAELFVNGKSVATADQKGKGVAEKISGQVPENGRAIVCVRGSDASREGRYNLGFQEGPAKAP